MGSVVRVYRASMLDFFRRLLREILGLITCLVFYFLARNEPAAILLLGMFVASAILVSVRHAKAFTVYTNTTAAEYIVMKTL